MPINNNNYSNFNLTNVEKEYFIYRLDDQINWYDSKSIKYKNFYCKLRIANVCLSVSIPILTKLEVLNFVMLCGFSIAIIEALLSTYKFQENWIEYRRICETLQHEKYMYLYKSGIYQDENSNFSYFVERVESIISQENLNWASLNNTKEN